MAVRLLSMKDAFPAGLPPPPQDMPDWVSMDYNQFAAFYHLKDLGTFTIPLANVNVHEGQRPEDVLWSAELRRRFADGIEAHAHPGVAILNTPQLPLDKDGNADPSQMRVSIVSSQHRCAARLGMDEPMDQKVWVFRVHHHVLHYAPAHLLGTWIGSYNHNSDRLPQKFQQNLMSMLLVVDAGYTPQNAHTGRKITSCLGTLDQVTRTIIKPFLSNPRVVTAFLRLHDIPLWNNIFMTAGNFKALNAKKWSNEIIADFINDICDQAAILTNHNVSLLTDSEFNPPWAEYQLNPKKLVLPKLRVLPINPPPMWMNGINTIDSIYSDKPAPVPNYFRQCGGMDAIQRLIDSGHSSFSGQKIYHPLYIFNEQFPLSKYCTMRKCVLNGVTYILGGHENWVFSTSRGAVPLGHEFPKPLNRSQEGVIFKYFSGFSGNDNVYDYHEVRQNALESYNKLLSFTDRHLESLNTTYHTIVVVPLGGPKAKIQDALPSLVEAKFQLLIATEQLWYDLLLEIGFTTGDVLPFSTKNFMLPETSPTMHLIGQASEHLQTIDTKLQDTEEARLVKLEEERAKEMKRAADAMKKAADDRVAKEKQQLEAATKRMEMLKEQHEQRLEAKLKDAEKQKEEAAILRRRVEEFKMFIEGLQRTSTVNDKDLEKLKELAEDPAFADQVLEDMPSDEEPSEPSSLADIINRIRHAHAISKLTASQPNPGPSMRMKSGNKAKATSSNIIDITHSDDEYDMGESSVIHQQLQQIPWGSFGLSTDLIGPAVHAIKSMDGEDKALFTNPINVKQIFKFGIRGLKDRWASQSEGSAASDSNSKRSYSGSAGGVTKKIRSMQVAENFDSPLFDVAINNVPVSKKKGKGKQCRRQRAIYTDDEDEDMEDGNDETPRSPDSPGGVSMLINEVI